MYMQCHTVSNVFKHDDSGQLYAFLCVNDMGGFVTYFDRFRGINLEYILGIQALLQQTTWIIKDSSNLTDKFYIKYNMFISLKKQADQIWI